MENNIRAIDSIIKAREDSTKDEVQPSNSFISSIMLSHIEKLQSNLYNFKFIAKIIDPDLNSEIYLNMLILINDSSVVSNSKYDIKNDTRLKLVNSYNLEAKENFSNSYRVDFSIIGPNNENDNYLKLEIINIESNSAKLLNINKELFFKISIFLYQLLNNNIIDGNIFYTKISSFRLLSDASILLNEIERLENINLYILYWNNRYIICYIIGPDFNKQIVYSCLSSEEYNNLMAN